MEYNNLKDHKDPVKEIKELFEQLKIERQGRFNYQKKRYNDPCQFEFVKLAKKLYQKVLELDGENPRLKHTLEKEVHFVETFVSKSSSKAKIEELRELMDAAISHIERDIASILSSSFFEESSE